MVGTNASTNEKHKSYNSTVQDISWGGGKYGTKVGAICARFSNMGDLGKTQVENRISKIFGFRGQTIAGSDQGILP